MFIQIVEFCVNSFFLMKKKKILKSLYYPVLFLLFVLDKFSNKRDKRIGKNVSCLDNDI